MKTDMTATNIGSDYILRREQWKGKTAKISDYPGLLDAVQKYTWSYTTDKHPYLKCSKTGKSLHRFVLEYLYGEETIKKLIDSGNIIEHLDNDGLNCSYSNLHILSADMNKAKAFSIDERMKLVNDPTSEMPPYILDVYYLYDKGIFQLQIFFNKLMFANEESGKPIEMLYLKYDNFDSLFIDWFYLLSVLPDGKFEIVKLHANTVNAEDCIFLELSEEEKGFTVIQKDGKTYINLDAPGFRMVHTALRDIE